MNITVDINGKGNTRLFLQPVAEDETNTKYLLSEGDNNNPLIRVNLDNNRLIVESKDSSIIEDSNILHEKLNLLAIELIEALQQGKDLTEKSTIEEYNPYDPELIRVDTRTFSLRQIYDMIKSGDINLSPDFQRNLVWDDIRKSRLIESILLRIPLPMFYFSQDEEGILSVVDGLQRLSAIKQFMDNKLALRNLEYLEKCNGCYYSEKKSIDDKYVRWFNMTQITVNIVDPQSPYKVKYDIFRRLNTGGQPLNSQELRNCLAHNNLRKVLREMVTLKSFLNATTKSISDVRMDAQELALRFIYFYDLYTNLNLKKYSGTIDTSLDELVDRIGKTSYEDLEKYIKAFDCSMRNAQYLFGRQAFRKVHKNSDIDSWRSPINKALFVSCSVILSQYEHSEITKNNLKNSLLSPLGNSISADDKLFNYLSYGTNGRSNLLYIFQSIEKLVENSIKA
jgi:Protein of unknown function DUF262.